MTRVKFDTYLLMEEALIVHAALLNGGFDATIDNYHHASMDWGSIIALGGITIRVPEKELWRATTYLKQLEQSAEERLNSVTDDDMEIE